MRDSHYEPESKRLYIADNLPLQLIYRSKGIRQHLIGAAEYDGAPIEAFIFGLMTPGFVYSTKLYSIDIFDPRNIKINENMSVHNSYKWMAGCRFMIMTIPSEINTSIEFSKYIAKNFIKFRRNVYQACLKRAKLLMEIRCR